MPREFQHLNAFQIKLKKECRLLFAITISLSAIILSQVAFNINSISILSALILPIPVLLFKLSAFWGNEIALSMSRKKEVKLRKGADVLGAPPKRDAIQEALKESSQENKKMIDRYLVGYTLETGESLWVSDQDMCGHACVFAKTGGGKTLWMESLILQQMARGRASGCTFIDAKRDSETLSQIILMALVTGRIEDLIVIDPFDPVHSYNFVHTNQHPDVKARKVLRAGLPPISEFSTTKHYDRLAHDSISRMVRALESLGMSWSIHDIASALSVFQLSYPHIKTMLEKIGATEAIVELGHLANSYRSAKGSLDASKLVDNLRGISSELHAISRSSMGGIFCTPYTDLQLTKAIQEGKIIYFMLPRLEEAESATRMIKLFREDLEVAIGEVTSSSKHNLEDPHLVIIDEGASTFGPTWANLFELARKGRFSLIFGAQSTGGLTDQQVGLSEAFYQRVMANVNLKVMMRVGDNRTAQDMADWFGMRNTTRKTLGSSVGQSSLLLNELSSMRSTESESEAYQEAADYVVSPEELKHEMSAEKGLAWFDMGDGQIVKGRCSWVDSEIPDGWESRKFITKFEHEDPEPLQLGEWIDQQIIKKEQQETEREQNKDYRDKAPEKPATHPTQEDKEKERPNNFKASPNQSLRRNPGHVRKFPIKGAQEEKDK